MRRVQRRGDGATLRSAVTALATLGALAALAGCGDSRTPVPSLSQPVAPRGFHTLGFSRSGVTLIAPKNWIVFPRQAPVLTVVVSGAALVTVKAITVDHPGAVDHAVFSPIRRTLRLLRAAAA